MCENESKNSNAQSSSTIIDRNFVQSQNNNKRNGSPDNSEDDESESEIDLTTTNSPKRFVLVNGCIDFSNNNNSVK